MQKQQPTGTGTALSIVIGLVAILPWIGILVAGWEIPTTQDKALLARILSLESQIQNLNEQIESLQTKPNLLAAGPTATITAEPTATFRLTPIPPDRVLVVVVAKGNVRAGPSTDHRIIGSVEAGDIIDKPLGREKNGWYRFCCLEGNQPGWVGPIVVNEQNRTSSTPTETPIKVNHASITTPPNSLGVSPLYTKYLNANGVHILSPADVNDQALIRARDILHDMVSTRPDLLAALTMQGLRIILFDNSTTSMPHLPEFKEWETAGQHDGGYLLKGTSHTVAAPEQQLRCSRILTHEIAHAIDYAVQWLDSDFADRRDAAYQNAKSKGAWVDPYAATNTHEYWAEVVSHWFHSGSYANRLSRIDPEAARLVKSVFGNAELSSQPC